MLLQSFPNFLLGLSSLIDYWWMQLSSSWVLFYLQLTTETERQNLAKARESLLSEHRSLLQSVVHQKQELAIAQAEINRHQTLPHLSAAGATVNKMVSMLHVTGLRHNSSSHFNRPHSSSPNLHFHSVLSTFFHIELYRPLIQYSILPPGCMA